MSLNKKKNTQTYMSFAIFTFVKKAMKAGLRKYFNIFPNLSYKKRNLVFFAKKKGYFLSL